MATKNSIGSNIPVEVTFGGLEQVTHTNHGPLKGNGSSAVGNFGAGTNGQILIGSSLGAPTFNTITAGTNINITNSSNGIDITVNPSGGGTFSGPTSWTPVLEFTTSSAGITYTTQSAFYWQFDKVILFTFNIVLSSKGSASGDAFISGIPGTIDGVDEFPCSLLIYNSSGFAANIATQGLIQVSSNIIEVTQNNYNTSNPSLTDASFTNTSQLIGNGLYFVV